MYDVSQFDTLYSLTFVDTAHDEVRKTDYQGWILQRKGERMLLTVKGHEMGMTGPNIAAVEPVPVNEELIALYSDSKRRIGSFTQRDFDENYLIGLWFHKKGKPDIAQRLLPRLTDTFFDEQIIINDFGTKYYDGLLKRFCMARNYPEAIRFGEQFNKEIFEHYEYQKSASELTAQLKSRTEDFKTFNLPDAKEWNSRKQKMNRTEQIRFLAERLRLINCIQPGQPAGISYADPQFALPISEIPENVSYWNYNEKYCVINPYNELVEMQLTPPEVELLLPYLLDRSFIPTYTYHRDFMSGRTNHRMSWVLNDLIYTMTDKHFFNSRSFDSLNTEGRSAAIETIRKWCVENKEISQETRTNTILNTTAQWSEFTKALQTARTKHYAILLPVIEKRFNDFQQKSWRSHKGVLARLMYEEGNEKYISVVQKWNENKDEREVIFWTSLFLLKNDKDHYNTSIKKLESVLKDDDGSTFYPHAIDVLLNLKTERAKKLAEGILNKQQFMMMMSFDWQLNCVKKLIAAKSDYTLNFLSKKLNEIVNGPVPKISQSPEAPQMFSQSDMFASVIDKLRSIDYAIYTIAPGDRQKYVSELEHWFNLQVKKIKSGEDSEMNLTLVETNEPVQFLDAAND
jgi:hypothetical protein